MSLLSRFVNGSLVSSERLMRAREFYAPSRLTTGTVEAFDYWTEGASVQSELAYARELAGMPDAELQALAEEFNRCQTDRHQAGSASRTSSALSCSESASGGLAVRGWPTAAAENGWQCSS